MVSWSEERSLPTGELVVTLTLTRRSDVALHLGLEGRSAPGRPRLHTLYAR